MLFLPNRFRNPLQTEKTDRIEICLFIPPCSSYKIQWETIKQDERDIEEGRKQIETQYTKLKRKAKTEREGEEEREGEWGRASKINWFMKKFNLLALINNNHIAYKRKRQRE